MLFYYYLLLLFIIVIYHYYIINVMITIISLTIVFIIMYSFVKLYSCLTYWIDVTTDQFGETLYMAYCIGVWHSIIIITLLSNHRVEIYFALRMCIKTQYLSHIVMHVYSKFKHINM